MWGWLDRVFFLPSLFWEAEARSIFSSQSAPGSLPLGAHQLLHKEALPFGDIQIKKTTYCYLDLLMEELLERTPVVSKSNLSSKYLILNMTKSTEGTSPCPIPHIKDGTLKTINQHAQQCASLRGNLVGVLRLACSKDVCTWGFKSLYTTQAPDSCLFSKEEAQGSKGRIQVTQLP